MIFARIEVIYYGHFACLISYRGSWMPRCISVLSVLCATWCHNQDTAFLTAKVAAQQSVRSICLFDLLCHSWNSSFKRFTSQSKHSLRLTDHSLWPRMNPGWTRMNPGWPRIDSRMTKDDFRMTQDDSRMTPWWHQDDSRMTKGWPRMTPRWSRMTDIQYFRWIHFENWGWAGTEHNLWETCTVVYQY